MTATKTYLAVETGGTKILARMVDESGRVLGESRWPTTTPAAAIEQIVEFARQLKTFDAPLRGAGIAAFGPILLDPAAGQNWGKILETPKPGWTGANLRRSIAKALNIPCRIDTDVNAAARAELDAIGTGTVASLAYVTIGTGIGAGLATLDGTLKGAMHPEIGHLRLIRPSDDQSFDSACPFHSDCAEGLAAGPAVQRRLGPGETLASRPDVANQVADYVGQLLVAIVLAWSPHRIVLGGGVGNAADMLELVRGAFVRNLGSYGVGHAARGAGFISAPLLATSGLEGALLLAREAASPIEDSLP